MNAKYTFFYDESEHSRKINFKTITQDNYYDNFVTVIVGWKDENTKIKSRYEEFENKYSERKKDGEIKSSTINNSQLKYGFASLNKQNLTFMNDFLDIFDEDIYIYFSVTSKLEYIINQIFIGYDNNYFVSVEAVKYTIVKALIMYKPIEVLEGIYNNTQELLNLLRKFFAERIEANKMNRMLKESETIAFKEVIQVLNKVNTNFKIEWEYKIAFHGFNLFLNEMGIENYSLILDKEGDEDTESETIIAAKKVNLKNITEQDSKEYYGIRFADMFAGIISKFLKKFHENLVYKSIEDGINKKILNEKWFDVSDEKLCLYKKLRYIISFMNDAWYKSFVGSYSDDLLIFIRFINYISDFSSSQEIKETGIENLPEYFNSDVYQHLEVYFQRMDYKNNISTKTIDDVKKDFFIGQYGEKVYFEANKQPKLQLNEGTQIYEVLSVGINKNNQPTITIFENESAICYRINESFISWVVDIMALANRGIKIFPSQVLFTVANQEYFANIL